MRAAIHNPYLDTLGGGERYTLSFAKVLADLGWKVDLEWKDASIMENLQDRFGIDLKNVAVVPDIKRGDGYDLCFWLSDGSIPSLKARKNILHFQVPFHHLGSNNLINKMKLFRVDKIICNSQFTKKFIDKEYGVESIVVYPPVDVEHIKPKRKENIILAVGRFSQLKQSKHQDILINAFKKLFDGGMKNWKLILAGGIEVGVGEYLESLEDSAKGYPIQIIKSPDYKTLKDLYGTAKIFWSASGFGENANENPEKVEHFGITVVEAMSAGAVPLAFNAGGHREIIEDKISGYLWDLPVALRDKTKELFQDSKKLNEMSRKARESSIKFSYSRFQKDFLSYIL